MLSVTYTEALREIALVLGIRRDYQQWTAQQAADVAAILRTGQRRFYFAAIVPESPAHSWSFLRPVRGLSLLAGQSTYTLPEDFGELVEPVLAYSAGKQPVMLVTEEKLRALAGNSDLKGDPKYAALRVKKADAGPVRYELIFYPTPDKEATISYRSSIVPPEWSEDNPHPACGARHSETLLESCLAAAEQKLLDGQIVPDGTHHDVHQRRYVELLAASIAADKRLQMAEEEIWPIEPLTDTLSVTKSYLKRLIARELGFVPHEGAWDHRQAERVRLALETGLRKFYSPQVLPGEKYPWQWSFLKPLLSVSTAAGKSVYELPDDLAILDGHLTYAPGAAVLYQSVELIAEHQIRHFMQRQSTSSRPRFAAVRPKPPDPSGRMQYELLLWPTPDGEYHLTGRYKLNPAALKDDQALPLGGQPHAQTVIEACLSAAEEQDGPRVTVAKTGLNGKVWLHSERFLECLIASVGHDRQASSSKTLGYNADRSDRAYGLPDHHEWDENIVEYVGYDHL